MSKSINSKKEKKSDRRKRREAARRYENPETERVFNSEKIGKRSARVLCALTAAVFMFLPAAAISLSGASESKEALPRISEEELHKLRGIEEEKEEKADKAILDLPDGKEDDSSDTETDDKKEDEGGEGENKDDIIPLVPDNVTKAENDAVRPDNSISAEDGEDDEVISVKKTSKTKKNEPTIRMLVTDDNKIVEMDLEDYVIGVVMAEMSSSKAMAALCAQAVAARTYVINRSGRYHTDIDADVCDSSGHCAGYISYEEAVKSWGQKSADKAYKRAKQAVEATKGIIMTYKGAAISACYFDNANGRTEYGNDVWGGNAPYLVSVETPEECSVKRYKISETDLMKRLFGSDWKVLSSEPIGKTVYDRAGKIDTVCFYGNEVSAQTILSRLYLRSADIEIKYSNGTYEITSYGYGHLVGMSQDGAGVYAEMGWTWQQILTHYYTGIDLTYYYKTKK